MKDAQVTTGVAEPRIFLVSPLLHCVSMTALVFLRTSFGYGFLRPKSLFFACSWTFSLYAIYAWIDGEAWTERRALLWFGTAAMLLYWFHFTVTLSREWQGTGRHDNDSGTSHAKRLLRWLGTSTSSHADRRTRLLIEPGIIAGVALGFYFVAGETHLSAWLLFTACCLWLKEVLNQWFLIRRHKRGRDLGDDLAESFGEEQTNPVIDKEPPVASARKERVKRMRTPTSPDSGSAT